MAGSFSSSSDEELIAGINVTPLVDVVLVLLVIFMITAPVLYQSAIKVHLPKARTGDESGKSPIQLTITRTGDLLWGREPIDWAALPGRLQRIGPSLGEQTATISADQATTHGAVIKLMDALRSAGLTRFALSVEAPSSGT